MYKTIFIILAAIMMFSARLSGQTSFASQSHVDSAEMLRRVRKTVDSLTLAIYKTLNRQVLTGLYIRRGLGQGILGHSDSAIYDYSIALKLNPKLPEVYVYRSAQLQRLYKYGYGIGDLQQAIALLQNNPARASMLYCYISYMQRRLKNYDEALKADSAAVQLNPNNGFAYISNGWTYFESNQYEKAIKAFDIGIPLTRNASAKALSENLVARAGAKRYLKKYRDAINDYSLALNINPDNRRAHWNRAASYNHNGDYELADAEYTKTITYYSGDNANLTKLYYDRALMEMGELKCREALRDDSIAITYNSRFGPAYWGLGDAHAQMVDFQESIHWYKQTMDYYDNDKTALSSLNDNIGNEAYFLTKYDEVVRVETKAIELNLKAWSPYLNRGRAYMKLGKEDKAMEDFNKVLMLDTTKAYAYAFALFYTGNGDKAIQTMQSNVIATTNSAILMSHYYNLACLYSLMNKPDEASAYLKKCIDGGYSKKYALSDPDLENLRNTTQFKDAIGEK